MGKCSQNEVQFIERSQRRIDVMVRPNQCCDTLLTIEPVRDHAVPLREPRSTDNNRRGQLSIKIRRTYLPTIQKQPPSMANDVIEECSAVRGQNPGLRKQGSSCVSTKRVKQAAFQPRHDLLTGDGGR